MPQIDQAATARVSATAIIKGHGILHLGHFSSIGEYVIIDLGSSGTGELVLGDRSRIKDHCVIRCYGGRIEFGNRCSLGEFGLWAGHGGIVVGNNVIVGPHVSVTASEHITSSSVPYRFQGERADGVSISDDVWLGARVCVLDGVHVGRRCVVGAGAIVTRDLAANFLYFGSPARKIRALNGEPWLYRRRRG